MISLSFRCSDERFGSVLKYCNVLELKVQKEKRDYGLVDYIKTTQNWKMFDEQQDFSAYKPSA